MAHSHCTEPGMGPHEQNMDSDYHIETFEIKVSECLMVILTDTEVSLTNLKTLFLSETLKLCRIWFSIETVQ